MFSLEWTDGRVEVVDADRVSPPTNDLAWAWGGTPRSEPATYHFWRNNRVVLAARAEDVKCVREVVPESEPSR